MSNPTKITLFFPKWDSFHLQIVSIALIYAYEKVQSIDYPQSFLQPLHSRTSSSVIDHEFESNPVLAHSLGTKSNHPSNTPEKETRILSPPEQSPSLNPPPPPPTSLTPETEEGGESVNHHNKEWIETRRNSIENWIKFILDSFKVDSHSLPSNPSLEDLTQLSKDLPLSMHLEIVHDLVLLSLSSSHLSHQDKSNKIGENSIQEDLRYSALDRQLIFLVAESLKIDSTIIYGAEKLVAQELFFLMQQTTGMLGENDSKSSKDDTQLVNSSQSVLHAAALKKKWLRYLGAGAGVIVGGVAIGLTGGLAAPILAPFLVGISGGALGFLATSGGAILIGTLFGLAGGGLTGYRAQRRLKGISEFTFERLLHREDDADGDIPRIPSLHATVVISGFLLTPTDFKDPWIPIFSKSIDYRDVYAIKVETQDLLSAGKGLETYVRDTLLPYGASELLSHTALASFCAALILPASVYKTAVMALDNEYQRTRDIFEKAGILLADMIEQEAHGARPLTLIGSGMGTITIFRAILELSRRREVEKKKFEIIDQVILICSPISPTLNEWITVRTMVTRRLVNVYSKNDWVLNILGRLDSFLSAKMSTQVAGLVDLGLPDIISIDVSDLVHGHLELNSKMPQILDRININA